MANRDRKRFASSLLGRRTGWLGGAQRKRSRRSSMQLHLEQLEDRRVLAPVLSGITANDGTLLQNGQVRNLAPTELTLNFNPGERLNPDTLASGIQISRAGADGALGTGDDVAIAPGFIGLGDEANQVIVRFASSLPDDRYRITIIGSGNGALMNLQGDNFNNGQNVSIDFELDLGARVLGVVPQPVTRNANGSLSQARDQIIVYFNDDDLNATAASDPRFYKLIFTGHSNQFDPSFNTVNTSDDVVFVPTSVAYSAVDDTAVLTFASNIDELSTGPGTYRLRIGTDEAQPLPPNTIFPSQDPGSSVATADTSVGTLTSVSQIVFGVIGTVPTPLLYPGSSLDPGHSLLPFLGDGHVFDFFVDTDGEIPIFAYNFKAAYGNDANGNPLINSITPEQRQRAREVFELYGHYLGIDVVESEDFGITIATGDLRVVDPTVDAAETTAISGLSNAGDFLVAIMSASQTWESEFAGNWFTSAMQQVGFLLGMGSAFDLPEGTIMGGDRELTFGRSAEAIFPGDHDIVHGRYLYNPEGNDIDMYRFVVPNTGRFTAEIAAERYSDTPNAQQLSSSQFDSVLRLFRETPAGPELVAQNDNYFSQDSFLQMDLTPGTYFIGVSSAGNDSYNPRVEDSGIGGTTVGGYQLRVDFRPATNLGLVDTTGTLLDGDGDGVPGGVFNFWFRAAGPTHTLFVDKATTSPGNGTLSAPFRDISGAINAAQPGSIIRIVGNTAATPADIRPYELGFNNLGQLLPDTNATGANGLLRVPDGVTMMIDPGTVFKSQRSAIIVGSTLVTNDASGGAVQVLGTPNNNVIFTSYNDNSIGGNVNLQRAPARGDWGGIVLRADVDNSEGRFSYDESGIFLNYINQSTFRYGGGIVSIDAVLTRINPITMVDARPTVTHNSISLGADAALSASPNSFLETTFHEPRFQEDLFTSDYSRIGPDIQRNRIFNNTTNGLVVGNRFGTFMGTATMTVPGRWNDDVVYVLQQGLVIAGTPGGTLGEIVDIGGDLFFQLEARPDARLAIDPGTVVKLEGAQIEVTMGATLLAEGTSSRPIVITSLADDRYGASGSFDTNSEATLPRAADWAGIYLGPTSIGSLDHVVLSFGGGTGAIQGTFTHFNPIEIHQGRARITNSRFENNADGVREELPSNRGGRTPNEPGTIFVGGAQPVIVGNDFISNDGPTISVNVNSLNHHSVFDTGRQTGAADRIARYGDNQGPLVRENRISDSEINGMVVRGGTLTTESVWDDTDIVHVLFDGVFVPNFHTFGGLTLKSTPNQSLVVKLSGKEAGFVTTGSAMGIADHIGGILNVIGRPGFPVVLTSLWDDSVGAGLDTNNRPQTDTDGGGRPARTEPASVDDFQIEIKFGPRILGVPEAVEAARLAASYWEQQFTDPMNIVIDVELEDRETPWFPTIVTNIADQASQFELFTTTPELVSLGYNTVRNALANDAGAHESILAGLPALDQLSVNYPSAAVPFETSTMMTLTSANAKALSLPVGTLPTSAFDNSRQRDGTILVNDTLEFWDFDRRDGLKTYREDFQTQMMREIGTILGFSSSLDTVNFFVQNPVPPTGTPGETNPIELSPLDLFRFAPGQAADDFTGASRLMNPFQREHVFYAGGNVDFREWNYVNMNRGEIPLATGFPRGDESNDTFGAGYWHDENWLRDAKAFYFDTIGVMDPVSHLRDSIRFEVDPFQTTQGLIINISEADRIAFDSIGYNVVGGAPGDWKGIDLKEMTHDGNVALVMEGELADSADGTNNTPTNAEFLGVLAPNRQSMDINQRIAIEVHGFINQPSDVDVYSFSATAGTQVWIDIDRTSAGFDGILELVDFGGTVLFQSDDSLAEGVFQGPDLYSINELDPALRVTLPGPAGQMGTYYVRVRSFSEDLSELGAGLTEGRYQMQIRLREQNEVPGTNIQHADIRYAQTGITVSSAAVRSPLMGEQTEDERLNDAPSELTVFIVDEMGEIQEDEEILHNELPFDVRAQYLGNLLTTRNGAISIYGNLRSSTGFGMLTPGDIDWYQFEVDLPVLNVSPSDNALVGVVFDIDWADGLNRPDTAISVFDSQLNLIYFSNGSNVAADQQGTAPASDLSRGSYGPRDPFIGPVEVAAGSTPIFGDIVGGLTTSQTLYVAVSSINMIPAELLAGQGNIVRTPVLNDVDGNGSPRRGESIQVIGGSSEFPVFAINPAAPANAILTGAYQLEIRTAPVPDAGFIASGPNANTGFADRNRERLQGVINVSANSITDSLEWGIHMANGLRDLPEYFPNPSLFSDSDLRNSFNEDFIRQRHTQFSAGRYVPNNGAVRALPNVNSERLGAGINIVNNVIAGGFAGGMHLQGDPNGIILTVFGLPEHIDLIDDFDVGDLDQAEFTLWDHHRNSQTFQFTISGDVKEGAIAIRIDNAGPEQPIINDELFASIRTNPTSAQDIAQEIEHAIRRSNLDVRVYRQPSMRFFGFGNSGGPPTLFIEGAVELGNPDVIVGDLISPIFLQQTQPDPTTPLPVITAEIAQQGAVPYANVVNNTLFGRGGSLLGDAAIGDIGMLLEDNVSPTLMNNIVANFGTGIRTDLSSTDTNTVRRTFVGGSTAPQFSFGGMGNLISNFEPFTILSDAIEDPPTKYDLGRWGFVFDLFGGLGGGGGSFGADTPLGYRDIDSSLTTLTGTRPTVIAGTLYQGNRTDTRQVGLGTNSIRLTNDQPLFVDPLNGNYFLAAGSRAIDSSIDALAERSNFAATLSSIGLTSSGIVAPTTDLLGITRVDDPSVEPPAGLGNNAFKDRGALERADFVSPRAVLIRPQDNDLQGTDQDPAPNSVSLPGTTIPFFEIQLLDGPTPTNSVFGSGIDDTTVTPETVTVFRNDTLLVEGTDYLFEYNPSSDSILLIPAAGLWESGFTYRILLDNTAIKDRAENPLQANNNQGETLFTIATDDPLDFGDAPEPYPTLLAEDGARHIITSNFFLGAGVSPEPDARRNADATADTLDDGVTVGTLFPGRIVDIFVTASAAGFLSGWIDFNANGTWETSERVFTDVPLVSGSNRLVIGVPENAALGQTFARFRFSSVTGLAVTGLAPDGEVEDYRVLISQPGWQNPNDPLDVNNDGSISPSDANQIITELTLREYSSPLTGAILTPTPPDGAGFLDTNGDGFISPVDAILVINALALGNGQQAPLSASAASFAQLDGGRSQDRLASILDDMAEEIAKNWSLPN